MRTKDFVVAALAGLASLTLSACGSQKAVEPGEPATSEAAAAAEASAEGPAAPDNVPSSQDIKAPAPAASSSEKMAMTSPVTKAPTDIIRSKGGLEDKCQAAVAKETRAPIIGINRISESQAAIEIYVNVQGATAPWKCLAYRDGTIGEVSFTGDEGAL